MWTVAVTTLDGRLHLLDGETGSERFSVLGHSKVCGSVAMSPDGSLLATASEDSSWKMFDASSGRELLAVAGHDGQGACICPMDEEGQRAEVIASCTRNGHARGVIDVAFSPCGQRIATAGGENEVMIWSAFTGEEELRLDMPWFKCTSAISVTFSPDASRIATGSDDERICVWNARNGELIHTILHAHVGSVESLCFSPDGLSLASVGGDDGCGKIWDAASGAPLRELEDKRGDDSACVKFAPDGRFLAAGSTAGSVTLWDVATGEEALCLSAHTGRHGCICTLHFGEDEEGDMTVVHDAACPHVGHRDPAWSVCFAPDGDALFSSSDDGTVKCWDAATGALRRTLVVGAQVKGITVGRDWVRDQQCVAFAMGQLERLGAGSRVRGLDPGVVRMVLEAL